MNRDCFPNIISRIYLENSGGTQPPKQVISSFNELIRNYSQPGGYSKQSLYVNDLIEESKNFINLLINNNNTGKIILSNSATQIAINISNSLNFNENDEIILSNLSHESAIGPFTRLPGINYKFWNVTDKLELDYENLNNLINDNTKLLVLPHVSNILGNVYDIKKINSIVKKLNPNVKIYVDGVAYLAHRLIDVEDFDIDFYVVSFYKFLGFRISMLYVKNTILSQMKTLNHYFLNSEVDKLQVGGIQYELCSSITGIKQYICDYFMKNSLVRLDIKNLFKDIIVHENSLIKYFNENKKRLDNIGLKLLTNITQDRVPIFSLYSENLDIEIVVLFLNQNGIECKSGNFYSKRLLQEKNIQSVLRISLAHYNSIEELEYFFKLCDNYKSFDHKLTDSINFKIISTRLSDNVKNSFNNLFKDPYYENERYKRFSLIDVKNFKLVGSSVFLQNSKYNSYLGDKVRQYHHIESSLLNDTSFKYLINNFINYIDPDSNHCNYVYIHQIRVVSDPDKKINPVPEGIHKDGYQFICICCANQFNIECPDNQIFDSNKNLVQNIKLIPNHSIILNDKNFYHNVSSLISSNDEKGYRDVFVITTIK